MKAYLLAAGALTIALSTAAQAQDQAAAAADDATGEIIVTATKRAERLQDVPLAVSVVNGAALEASSGSGLDALQVAVPTLTLRRGTTVANSAVVLRGVGTLSFSLAAEPAVSTIIDGVVFARSGQAFNDLFDIERVEVLRGPQGTLFGKNASAGVLNIITKAPSNEFEGNITAAIFEDQEYRLRGSVSGPLTDKIRARVSGSYSYFDGNIRNVTVGKDVNGYERTAVRAVVDFEASDRLDFRLIGDYAKTNDDCCAEVIGTLPTGALANAILADLGTAVPRGDKTRRVAHNLVSRTKGDTGGVSLQGNLDIGDHTVTSITAWRDWSSRELREGDFLPNGASYINGTASISQLHDDGDQSYKQFSQELRLTSPTGGLLEYQVGLFMFNVDGSQIFTRSDIVCTATTLPANATGSRPCVTGQSTFTTPTARSDADVEFRNRAAFGQATINLTDDFRLIAGARYTHDEVSFSLTRVNLIGNGGPGISNVPFPPAGTPGGNSTKQNDFSFRAGAQYDFSDDVMAYATYSQGYKGPAFNVFFNMGPTDVLPIKAETADSYEIGIKSATADRSLVLNAALFYAEYDNFQANSFRTINNSVVTNLTNAGTVRTQGFEADFVARPSDNFTFSGGVAYADAEIKEFPCPAVGAPVGCTTRKGEPLPLAPKWKFALNAEQRIPMVDLPFDAVLSAQYTFTDDQYSSLRPITTSFAVFRNELIESYSLVNASLALKSKDERYTLTFMVQNLFDTSFAALKTPGGPGGSYRYIIPREADRHFGASLQVKF